MNTITQTNRTILFEEINPEKLNLLTLVGDVRGVNSVSDDKIKEIKSNPYVAFTTIPHSGNEHVKAKGIVQKSSKTIFDIAEQFIAKIPDYKDTIEYAGKSLILFEVRFDTAIVTKDLDTIKTLQL